MPIPWPQPAPRTTKRVAASALAGRAIARTAAMGRRARRIGATTPISAEGSGALGHSEETPVARHPAQLVRAPVLEVDSRADHEVLDRARDEHLAGLGTRHHPGGYVHGEAAQVVAHHLELARVEARAQLEPQLPHGLRDRCRAADRPGGAVEGGEEAVAGALDLAAAVELERPPEE